MCLAYWQAQVEGDLRCICFVMEKPDLCCTVSGQMSVGIALEWIVSLFLLYPPFSLSVFLSVDFSLSSDFILSPSLSLPFSSSPCLYRSENTWFVISLSWRGRTDRSSAFHTHTHTHTHTHKHTNKQKTQTKKHKQRKRKNRQKKKRAGE